MDEQSGEPEEEEVDDVHEAELIAGSKTCSISAAVLYHFFLKSDEALKF